MDFGSVEWYIICSLFAIANLVIGIYGIRERGATFLHYAQVGIGIGLVLRMIWEAFVR